VRPQDKAAQDDAMLMVLTFPVDFVPFAVVLEVWGRVLGGDWAPLLLALGFGSRSWAGGWSESTSAKVDE